MFRTKRNKRQRQETAVNIEPYPLSYPTGSCHWVPSPGSNPLPDGLVPAGRIETGQNAFIGRANMGDQLATGFFLMETMEIHIPYGCDERVQRDFEMLVVDDQDAIHWMKCFNGRPPERNEGSVPLAVGGPFAESMLIGRTCNPLDEGVTWQGSPLELSRHVLTGPEICRAGKIHRSHGCLYIPYGGREYIFNTHEMLMLKPSSGSLQNISRWNILKRLQRHSNLTEAIDKLRIPTKLKDFLKANR